LRTLLKKTFASTLARNALWMSFGQGTRLVIQAAYFALIARSLGVKNYGAFISVVALVGIVYPFAAAGRGDLLVRNVARDQSRFPEMWGSALSTIMLCGTLFIGLVIAMSYYALPHSIPVRLVLLVAFSDIIGLNIITVAGQAFQSFERLNWTASLNVLVSASRLTAALLLYFAHRAPSPLQWGYAYFGSTALIAMTGCWFVSAKLPPPILTFPHSWIDIRQGLYFSISLSAQTIYNDIDKTMLARLSTLTATGIYGAAYRIIDVSFAPVSALLYAAYPNFFRKGATGISSSLSYARPLLIRSVSYALLATVAILLFAGIVPWVLGRQYLDTAEALRWLAPLPILKSMHYCLSTSLSGAGHQGIRCVIQVGVAVFNVLINLWLIPHYSWRGAAWSSIASDALLAAALGAGAFVLAHRERANQTLIEGSPV
jgi:O-antigen/teichoic acid export membrane protein